MDLIDYLKLRKEGGRCWRGREMPVKLGQNEPGTKSVQSSLVCIPLFEIKTDRVRSVQLAKEQNRHF